MIITGIIASLMFGTVSTTYDGLPISNDCVVSYSVTYNNNIGADNKVLNVTDVVSFGFDVIDEGSSNYIYYLKWVDIDGSKNVLSDSYETTNISFDTFTYYVNTVGTMINYRIAYDLNDGDVYHEYDKTIIKHVTDTYYGTFEASRFKVNKVNLENQLRANFANSISGYNQGYQDGYVVGNREGNNTGYQDGYAEGYSEGVNTDQTAYTIFNGFLTVGMLPINVLLQMLNFDILGINISNFVTSILTVGITIIILKMFVGKSGGGSDA